MFNTKTIPFEVSVIILRSNEDTRIFQNERTEIRNIESINIEENEEESEEPIINIGKIFKSDECIICLTNSPNVLFCNCGDIPICVECEEVKSLVICPFCKTENTIKRTIEY